MTTSNHLGDSAPDRPADGRARFARVGRVLPVAVVQVGGTLLATRVTGNGGPPWGHHGPVAADTAGLVPLAVVLLVLGVVVLPWRWHFPRSVLVGTLATTIAYALVVSPRGPFVAALTMAMANAWLRGHRWAVGVVAGVAVAVLPTADTLTGRASAPDLTAGLLATAWATVTIVVAELVRLRLERVAGRRRLQAEAEQQRARDERVRIARELHDSVAHSMSLINLQSGVALHLGADLPAPTRDALTNIRDASRDALVELRTVLGVLRSVDGTSDTDGPARTPIAGLDRLPDLVERARAAGLDVRVDVSGDPRAVDGAADRNAFRIVQESVTNVMKHAPRHRAEIALRIGPEVVDLVVEDRPVTNASVDGLPPDTGADTPAPLSLLGATGNGLIGMRERATAVGGSFSAGPTSAGGWRVTARLPVGVPTHAETGAPA